MAAKPDISFPSFGSPPDLIFLSYARADRARVEPLAVALRARGASVWYDAGLTAGGSSYVESVRRALRRTGVMLVFISAASASSAWVADELRAYRSLMASEPGRQLLAIYLDKTRAPLALAGVSAVDAHDTQPEITIGLIASALENSALIPAQPDKPMAPQAPSASQAAPTSGGAPAPQARASATAPVTGSQVFMSYDRADRERVQPLIMALRERGVPVWDDGGIAHGGAGYVEAAGAAIARSQTLLVAVSAASVASPWVEDETRSFLRQKAREAGRALIAIHLDQTPAPLGLNGASSIDVRSLTPDDAARLIVDLLPASGPVTTVASGAAVGPVVTAKPAPTPAPSEVAPVIEAAPSEPAPVVREAPVAAVVAAMAAAAPEPEPAPVAKAAPVAGTAPAESAPIKAAPLPEVPMEETAPAMKALPSEEAAQAAPELAAEPFTYAALATDVKKQAASATPEVSEWNPVIGLVVLIIALLIGLAFVLWAHAGFPLPAGWGL